MDSVRYITKQLDDIVYVDLGSIRNVANESLPEELDFIIDLIDSGIDLYGTV